MVRDMSYFNEYFYQQDLKELKMLDIVKHKTENEILDAFKEKKLREKPWITKVKLQSIKIKNNLYNK